MVGSAVEQLSQELDGRVQIAKVNVDERPEIAARYGVRSIPSLSCCSKAAKG
jgi:thioredoxin 1